ncbi:MAG: helix-turn-helix transcriptional regulator [bacterium]|nr:helix-turn-helix transcriptional regulator [bacterium]
MNKNKKYDDLKEEAAEVVDRLKAIRAKLGITQRDMAEKLNSSTSTLSDIENAVSRPKYDFFHYISKNMGVSLEYLFHGKGAMFASDEAPVPGPDGKPENIETFDDMRWYVERSSVVRHTFIAQFISFILKNEELIDMDIKKGAAAKGNNGDKEEGKEEGK